MFTAFFPLLSRLRRDPDAAWSLWRFLNDFSDALWEMHQDDFLQRFSDELHDDPWPAPDDPVTGYHLPDEPVADDQIPGDPALDDQRPDSMRHDPHDHSNASDPSLADLW